jgi:hydrogenase maturation protease
MTTMRDPDRSTVDRVVIGIGNDDRRDDGAGLAVARSVRGHLPLDIGVVECRGDLTRLLELWEGARIAILVDALHTPGIPGSIVRLEGEALDRITGSVATSTHGASLAGVLELARSLGRRPPRLVVYGIVAADVSHGVGLSEAVASGVVTTARRIEAELLSPTEANAAA